MKDFRTLVSKIREASGDEFGTKWAPKITEITNRYLGVGKKVSDCTPEQVEQLDLICKDIVEAIGEGI